MSAVMNATSTFSCPHNGTAYDGTLLCHWANSPGARGTLNIFWLCISTLGLCVWNAIHPDVPHPKTPGLHVFGTRILLLLVGLFMPGMLVLVALGNFRQACEILIDVDRQTGVRTEFPWWMHLFKVWRPMHRNPIEKKWWMRPLQWFLRGSSLRPESNFAPNESGGRDRQHSWTLTHSFYVLMNGFVDEMGRPIAVDDVPRRITLPCEHPMRLPDVPLGDIQNRGESSTQAKLLLVWQLFVFLANCFVRFNQSLPLSLLEIITVSHALSTTLVMMLWWYKPHNVKEPTIILARGPVPPLPAVSWGILDSKAFFRRALSSDFLFRALVVGDNVDLPQIILLVAAAVLYGLPHLLGLSTHFPTFAEQLCWQIATFTVIGSPLIMCVVVWILPHTYVLRRMGAAVDMLLQSLLLVLLILYPIASMLLVGESVRQIFALPVESFREPQLTAYLPSFS